MLRAIARERIKREVDPLLDALDEIEALAPETAPSASDDEARQLQQRLDNVREGFELITTLAHKFAGPSGAGLKTAAKLLAKAPVGTKRPAKKHAAKVPRRAKRGGPS